MEANMQVLEGAQYRLRVKLTSKAGEQLPPEHFRVYAGAFCPGRVPAHFRAERTAEEWVLTMPGLKPGRVPWNWQLLAAEYATGVEWLLAAGEVTVTPRHATGSGCVDPGELKIVAKLDKTTLEMTVEIGESTAACSLAVVAAQNSAKAADTSAKAASDSAEHAAEQAQAAETARKQADGSATKAAGSAADAATSAKAASNSAADAAASSKAAAEEVTKAAAEEEKAKLERETAARHATAAAQSAQKAMANQKGAELAAQAAAQAQTGAEQARTDADAAKLAAQTSEQNAKASEDAAAADKAAAEQAKNDALAAQSTAEEQAAIATKAAADAQAPESIAAQAARPATMLLVRDELLSLLGEASLFDIDTDGQKIIVHTDRLSDDKLAAVNDMLERFVPGFLEVVQYNHHIEVSWRDYFKYQDCADITALKKVNPDYVNDVTSSGLWCYSLPRYTQNRQQWGYGFIYGTNAKRVYLYLPAIRDLTDIIARTLVEEVYINAPVTPDASDCLRLAVNVTKAEIIIPEATNGERLFGDKWREHPIAKHLRLHAPKLSRGANLCDLCELDVASVLSIVETIPAWDADEHRLDLGIHVDHQNDVEVLAAIAEAEAKGWTLTVKWNGTPTVAAASTFGFGQLIYAKVGEMKLPDGTTERVLDWGHYVTNEEGYETFRSQESAYEHFGLPMPEESFS